MFKLLSKEELLPKVVPTINKDLPLFFDTETIGFYGTIRLAQFYQEGWDWALLVEYPDPMELAIVLKDQQFVCHNAHYDITTIQENLGKLAWVPNKPECTLYLSRLHFYKEQFFSLDKCIKYATGSNPYSNLDAEKRELQKSGWDRPTLTDDQLEYAALDVIYLAKLYAVVKEEREEYSYKLDIITLKSCLNYQCNGFPVDKARLTKKYEENVVAIKELKDFLPVNPNSPKQVKEYLDSPEGTGDDLLAMMIAKGKEEIVEPKIKLKGQRAAKIREARKLIKQNSFISKYDTYNGLVYGKFHAGARSGRMTCKDENLQQISRKLKCLFGVQTTDDVVMVYSDFSQLELRCLCAITGERNMEGLYRHGEDLHMYTAVILFGKNPTKQQRQIAKTANFGLAYGAGALTFAKILLKATGIILSEQEAKHIKAKWLRLWPAIHAWQKSGINAWRKQSSWQTLLGRKYVAKMMTDQLNIQIQGTGAEVARLANYYMDQKMKSEPIVKDCKEIRQVNMIHDSYIYLVPKDPIIYEAVCKIIADSMKEAWTEITAVAKIKDLPMPVEVSVGYNWGDIDGDEPIVIHTLNVE